MLLSIHFTQLRVVFHKVLGKIEKNQVFTVIFKIKTMKGAWEEQFMIAALNYYVEQKQTKDSAEAQFETYKFMPDIPRVTLWRRTLLIESGVPLDIACRKDLYFSDYSKYLDKNITSMTALEAKFRNCLSRKSLMKAEANNISLDDSCVDGYNANSERKFCSVPKCKSDSELQPNLTFFRLPDDDEKLAIWAERCQKPEWADPAKSYFAKKYALVCAHHFSKTMFQDEDHKELTEDAFPATIMECAPSNVPIPVINLDLNGLPDKDPLEMDPLDFESPTSSTMNLDNEPPPRMTSQVKGIQSSQETNVNLNVSDENPPDDFAPSRLLRKRNEEPSEMTKILINRILKSNKTQKSTKKKITVKKRRVQQSTLHRKRKVSHPFLDTNKRKICFNDNCSVPNCSKFCKEGFFVCKPCTDKGYVACVVSSCKKLFHSKNNDASYVYFPDNNEELNMKWKKAIGANANWNSASAVICLRHFRKPQDFNNDGLSLKITAVPSVSVARGKTKRSLVLVSSNKRAHTKTVTFRQPVTSRQPVIQTPKRTLPSRTLTPINNSKPEPVKSPVVVLTKNPILNEQIERKKQRLSVSKVKALLTIRGLRLKNEHFRLQNEKLRLQNLILQKQLNNL